MIDEVSWASESGGGDKMCKERTVGGEELRESPTKGDCGVLRHESSILSDAVAPLLLQELLEGIETIGEQE